MGGAEGVEGEVVAVAVAVDDRIPSLDDSASINRTTIQLAIASKQRYDLVCGLPYIHHSIEQCQEFGLGTEFVIAFKKIGQQIATTRQRTQPHATITAQSKQQG